MLSTRTIGLNFSLRSPSRGWRTWPTMASPRRMPNLRTMRERQVDVVGARQVAAGAHEGVVVEDVEDAGRRHQHVVLEDLGVRLVAHRGAATGVAALAVGHRALAVAVATPSAPVATAAAVLVEAVALLALAGLVRRVRVGGGLVLGLLVALVALTVLAPGRRPAGPAAPCLSCGLVRLVLARRPGCSGPGFARAAGPGAGRRGPRRSGPCGRVARPARRARAAPAAPAGRGARRGPEPSRVRCRWRPPGRLRCGAGRPACCSGHRSGRP